MGEPGVAAGTPVCSLRVNSRTSALRNIFGEIESDLWKAEPSLKEALLRSSGTQLLHHTAPRQLTKKPRTVSLSARVREPNLQPA